MNVRKTLGTGWSLKKFSVPDVENHPPLGLSAMTFSALPPYSYSLPTCNKEKQKRNASKRSWIWSPVWKLCQGFWEILRKLALHFQLRTKMCFLSESPAEQHLGGRHLAGTGCVPRQLNRWPGKQCSNQPTKLPHLQRAHAIFNSLP